MTKKTGILVTISIVLVVLVGIVGYSSQKNSEKTTVNRLAEALIQNDQTVVKQYMPSYSNKKKISKTARTAFQKQVKKMKKEQIVTFLQTEENFLIEKPSSYFKPAQIYPNPRFLVMELPKGSEMQAQVQSKAFSGVYEEKWNKYTFGPLIPGDYQLTYTVVHPKFGSQKLKKQVDLVGKDQRFLVKETSLYEGNTAFQKHLLASAVRYFDTFNDAVRSGFDMSKVGASKRYKETLQMGFNELKPFIESYEQEFQTLEINGDSISVNTAQTRVQLDLYIDMKRSLKLVEEVGIDEALISDKQNAIASFTYDDAEKKWLLDGLDFGTYQQDPEKWEHIERYRAEQPKKGQWDKTNAKNVV